MCAAVLLHSIAVTAKPHITRCFSHECFRVFCHFTDYQVLVSHKVYCRTFLHTFLQYYTYNFIVYTYFWGGQPRLRNSYCSYIGNDQSPWWIG